MRPFLALFFSSLACVLAQDASPTILSPPGQPLFTGAIGEFEILGNTLVSAQQMFLGTLDKVFIVDKVENNKARIDGHPAWASEFTLDDNSQRPMNAWTNSFCAGGTVLGNGTWLNVGGNSAVTWGGAQAEDSSGSGPYDDPDGGRSIRELAPTSDGQCEWVLGTAMTTRRWYPTVETLQDGTAIIIGGCNNGGYVNDAGQDNPTYEFYPPKGKNPITSPWLSDQLPINLYPLTWLLPSGKLLMQANRATILLDPNSHTEYELDDIPDAIRAYPASAGSIMLPLTPANNWTATVLFCGGTDNDDWSTGWNIAAFPASTSCVTITPDVGKKYTQDDPLPEARSMANLISLPDGRVLCLNGAQTGTAGYGNQSWAVGQSYSDKPALTPVIYDPSAPKGSKWDRTGLKASTVPRMYHSSATLLPDGAVLVSGSNPNSDYNVGSGVKYPTEYRVERFYPSYYNEPRPQPAGLLSQLSYGGPSFDVFLSSDDLSGDAQNAANATVVIIRTGFSTHSMNMGQRFVQLDSTYTAYGENNTATLHVSQVPPNPAILAPGPALLFVVVNGVPSVGVQVMVGSGTIGNQTVLDIGDLPASSYVPAPDGQGGGGGSGSGSQDQSSNGALHRGGGSSSFSLLCLGLGLVFCARTLLTDF
ncbi:copper radical oxidase [Roridomyces roridus]|uniref:Copper radical oxidase n=1 Tax=Roridomyces roridus TaxID=1738132 RepID=A0AAD7FZC0_9AGAR|nr:copper radical oxidase [Roridomyces roridus]